MDPKILRNLLTKYQNGTATDEERQQVEAWYNSLDEETETAMPIADQRAFVEHHWQEMAANIAQPANDRRSLAFYYRWVAAAVVVIGLGLSWYFLLYRPSTNGPERFAEQDNRQPLIDKTNQSTKPLLVALHDGSTILLQPGSRVVYPTQFARKQREVRLEGEAFFEVAKNPEQPFLVYANGMVTKVLGTSFTIIANVGKPTAEVVVRTGRVAVFRQTDSQVAKSDIILKPNEKATFYRVENRIVKALADQPAVLRPEAVKTHFLYSDTPVADVFRELTEVYGVEITFDAQMLRNCTLTANLSNQPLPVQLNMICLSIGAKYQIQGTLVQINGQGCP